VTPGPFFYGRKIPCRLVDVALGHASRVHPQGVVRAAEHVWSLVTMMGSNTMPPRDPTDDDDEDEEDEEDEDRDEEPAVVREPDE
jgi:hypothetical protein